MTRYTVVMKKTYENGNSHIVEIIDDENRCFSRKNAKGRYYVFQKRIGKNYRTDSLIETYKFHKAIGYKVVGIER